MNINNLYEAVPVNKELPPNTNDDFFCIYTDCRKGCRSGMYISYYQKNIEFWYRPVTRESIEAFLREFGEKVWDECETWKGWVIQTELDDKRQTAITELINKTLGQ